MKYYYFSYAYQRYGNNGWEICDGVCEGSVIKYFAEVKQKHEDGDYRLISFNEITEEEYTEHGGWFG